MRAENIVKYCQAYLNGFNDLYSMKSCSGVTLGILKIASYCLLIPPVIVGLFSLYYKKIAQIESDFDSLLDSIEAFKTNEIYNKIHQPENALKTNSKEFITYLVRKVNKIHASDISDINDIERVRKGFLLLSFEKQKDFFQGLADSSLLIKFLEMNFIPNDISELNFTLGNSQFQNLKDNDCIAMIFFKYLAKFSELTKLHLDLKGLGFYGPMAEGQLDQLDQLFASAYDGGSFWFPMENYRYDAQDFREGLSIYSYCDRGSPMTNAAVELRRLIHKAKNADNTFKYKLSFMNLMVDGDTKGTHSVNECDVFLNYRSSFSPKLIAFLNKAPKISV